MRILRVAQTCYPDVTGGGAYHVHAMSRDQAAMGHDVTVLTVRQDPDLPHLEERAGYTVIRYDPTVSLLGNALSIGLARHLHHATSRSSDPNGAGTHSRDPNGAGTRTGDPNGAGTRTDDPNGAANSAAGPGGVDVIHAHSHLYASTNLAALRRRLGGPPLAITNHGLYSQTAPEPVFEGYLRTVGRWTFDQADVVFCYTDVDERRLRELGVTSDVAVVPNGVDTERFRPDGPESDLLASPENDLANGPESGRPDGAGEAAGPSVLFVGRLVDGKRPQDAIAAMRQVRAALPGATLWLCGDGPLRETLERQANESLDRRADEALDLPASQTPDRRADKPLGDAVQFLGHVDYDEMPAVYRSADVLVLPSRAEGMPRTVLEARASGIPVVTTDLEHVAAGTDPGVRTVPVEDVDAIAAAIVAALDGDASDRDVPGEPDALDAEPSAAVAPETALLQGDGGQSVEPEDGSSGEAVSSDPPGNSSGNAVTTDRRPAHTETQDAPSAAAEGAPPREALDWQSTVRETTDVLERLVAETDPHR